MVRLGMLMVLLGCSAAHAASLSAQLDRATAALGEPLSLTVEARSLDLDALDLTPLDAHFEIFARTRSRGADSETLVLTLYPRMTGALPVPPLQLDTRRTPVLPLTVTDGSDAIPRVSAHWTLEPAETEPNQGRPGAPLRVSQPARLSLSICDDGSLQWQRPALPPQTGRVVRALGEDEGEGVRAGETCILHRFHWALLATREGAATLDIPMLDASRFGQRLRFPGPSLNFEAAALPAWLPEHVPPVAPVVRADPLPARWPLQRPLSWRFEVTGGYSADSLKALLDLQLRESAALGVYPPLIEAVPPDDLNSPLSRYAVTLFLRPRESGTVTLPALNLSWYDPARGRLASRALSGHSIEVFDPRWRLVGQMAGGLAGVVLLVVLTWQVRRTARWRLARRHGLRAIRQARDVSELAQAVRRFSLAGRPAASSLREWQRRMAQETGACDVAGAVCLLEQQRFGQTAPTLAVLQQALLQELAKARPLPRTAWRRMAAGK